MRWYVVVPLIGVPLGIGAAYTVKDKINDLIQGLVGRIIPGGVPSENYFRITVPFTIQDMGRESIRKLAESLKISEVKPVLIPPALDFHFNPIVLPTQMLEFRWSPPPYRMRLKSQPKKPGGPPEPPSKAAIKDLAGRAYRSMYKTKIEQIPEGWKVTLIMEVPI